MLKQKIRSKIKYFWLELLMLIAGIILCDGYGFTNCPGATKAVDEFLKDKPEKMMSLSGGGGFFIKGIQTAVSSLG